MVSEELDELFETCDRIAIIGTATTSRRGERPRRASRSASGWRDVAGRGTRAGAFDVA